MGLHISYLLERVVLQQVTLMTQKDQKEEVFLALAMLPPMKFTKALKFTWSKHFSFACGGGGGKFGFSLVGHKILMKINVAGYMWVGLCFVVFWVNSAIVGEEGSR